MTLLPIYAILAIIYLNIRIDEYGLSIARIWAITFAYIALFYSLGYAVSIIFYTQNIMKLVSPTNKYGAIISIITLLILHTPIADPTILSANNQYQRLISHKIREKDF